MAKRADAKKKPHYINNKDFSLAVVEYVKSVNKAREKNKPDPKVTDYIATSFLKISEGLSHRPNFVRYTYCLLYTSPSPRDQRGSGMPASG